MFEMFANHNRRCFKYKFLALLNSWKSTPAIFAQQTTIYETQHNVQYFLSNQASHSALASVWHTIFSSQQKCQRRQFAILPGCRDNARNERSARTARRTLPWRSTVSSRGRKCNFMAFNIIQAAFFFSFLWRLFFRLLVSSCLLALHLNFFTLFFLLRPFEINFHRWFRIHSGKFNLHSELSLSIPWELWFYSLKTQIH